MAPRFANDSHVLFELYNEPINNGFGSDAANWASVKTDMQGWINIVRAAAPNNPILVAGASWSQIIGPAASNPLTGSNLVMVSHIYPGHWLSGGQSWYTGHIDTCLTVYPVFMTEWGFTTTSDSLLNGTITNYGAPLRDFREARKISSSAWVASYDWQPPMFNTNWTLRVGQGEMGGFTKDMLYAFRNNDQPGGGGGSGNIEVRARGSLGSEVIDIRVNGLTVATHTLSTTFASYFGTGSGTVQVHFVNDNGSRDVQIDYVVVSGTTHQSENMPINTGVWTGVCGGSFSEWIHCNGYIEYGSGGGPVTLLDDGFETNFDKWTDGGVTDWDRTTAQAFAGSFSAHAGSADNDLISDNLNTAGKTSITIDLRYRDDDIDNSDDIYLQFYNGTSYVNFFELGNSTEDVWNQYTVTITSSQFPQYFRTNFRIKFEGSSIDSGENLWIDAVKVTTQ
jgi:hypothetical protein